jgi:hypothetical protein
LPSGFRGELNTDDPIVADPEENVLQIVVGVESILNGGDILGYDVEVLAALSHPMKELDADQRAIEPKVDSVDRRSQMSVVPLDSVGSIVCRFPLNLPQLFRAEIFVVVLLKLLRANIE